jgi:hypothetical protein
LNSSPLLPTPDFRPALRSPLDPLRSRQALQDGVYRDDDVSDDEDDAEPSAPAFKRPVPLHRRGLGAQLVQRMTGAMRYAGERALECPVGGKLSSVLPSLSRSTLTLSKTGGSRRRISKAGPRTFTFHPATRVLRAPSRSAQQRVIVSRAMAFPCCPAQN